MAETPNQHSTQPEGGFDEADALLDANLRALGAKIGPLPTGRTESAALKFVQAEAVVAGRSRRSRWLAAGSALAACIAIGAVVLLLPFGNKVEASTIINGLRAKQFGGVNVRFDHVSSRGTTVDGEMRMRLKKPVSIDQLDNPGTMHDMENFGASYGKFTISADESVPGWGGAKIEAEGALTPTSGWMFVRASDQTVKQLTAVQPRAAMLANMASAGLLLNVGGLDDSFFDGLNMMICPAAEAGDDAAENGSIKASASIQQMPGGKQGVRIGLSGRMRNAPGGDGAPSVEQLQRFAALARMVLSGKARQGELDQLTKMVQEDFSQHATVQNLGGGRYLLKADLPDPHHPASGKPDATLTVSYEESGGVQWAEIANLRDATGVIRFEFPSDPAPIDPDLLRYERLVETGKTNYLDLRMVMKMFMPGAGKTTPRE